MGWTFRLVIAEWRAWQQALRQMLDVPAMVGTQTNTGAAKP
jgi:hypothetical protein